MDIAKSCLYKDNKRINAGQVLKSLLVLAVIYCLLIACWPVVGRAYSCLYRGGANFLFGSFGSKGIVEFNTLKKAEYDIEVFLYNIDHRNQDGTLRGLETSHSSRRDAYIYIAFLVALIAATPISVKRKLWALLWGTIFIHCFIAMKLYLRLIDAFSREPLCVITISPFWGRIFYAVHQMFVENVNSGFVAAVLIWILVSFRRGDWVTIVSGKQESIRMPSQSAGKAKMARA